jgi:phage shock protein E
VGARKVGGLVHVRDDRLSVRRTGGRAACDYRATVPRPRSLASSLRASLFAFLLLGGLGLGATGCSGSDKAAPDRAPAPSSAKDPAAARALIAGGAAVVDVRTAEEYAEDHLANAVNVPVEELAKRIGEVDALVGGQKDRPVVVYCASGGRSAKAKQQLEAAGYGRVVNGGSLDDLR